jgi:hypothetical protein
MTQEEAAMNDGLSGLEELKYPVGKFKAPEAVTPQVRMAAIAALAEMPAKLSEALAGLEAAQVDTVYREGGWTVRQLVHHVADSHMNAFVRVRLALTEDWPTITGYNEKAWAELHDATSPVEWSVGLLKNLHARWAMLLESLTEEQWQRGFKHPERGPSTVEMATLLYAWHAKHHVAHITGLRKREGW